MTGVLIAMEKRCSHCDTPKPVSEFNKNRGHADGLGTWCRECASAYNQQYRVGREDKLAAQTLAWKRANKDRVAAWGRADLLRVRLECFALFGSECKHCRFDDHRALQIDHIYRATDEDRRSNKRCGQGLYRAILRGEKPLSDFQLLCANCNWIKRYENDEHNRRAA